MPTPPLTFLGPLTHPLDARVRWLVGLLQLLRPLTCTIATVFCFLGAYLSDRSVSPLSTPAFLAAAVVWLVAAFGFAINDYRDIEADRYGKPHRPIPAGRLTEVTAFRIAMGLAGLAIVTSTSLGLRSVGFALGGLGLCAAYSYWLKSTVLLGNLTVSSLDVAAIIYGSLAIGTPSSAVYLLSGLVGIYILGQEILHTTADCEGDAQAGLTTIATVLGSRVSLGIFQILTLSFALITLLPWLWHWVGNGYLFTVVFCSVLPALGAIGLLLWQQSAKTIYIAQWITKIIWFSSIVPILMLG